MKHYYPFLLILILSISKSYSQIDRKLINDWKYQAKKGDSVFLKNNKNLALGYYKKAKKISFLINEYPASIITYGRIQNASPKKESDSLLNKVINYIDKTYKNYNEIKTIIKDSIQAGGLQYYYLTLFENVVNQNKNILPAIKELAFIEEFGNHDLNSFYFYQKWEEIDSTSIKNYSKEYMNVAIKSGHISYNDKKYEDALIYYKKAIALLKHNPDLKSVFFEDLYMFIFNTYMAIDDCSGFIAYKDNLIDYYSKVYGENNVKTAYLYNELGVCYNNNTTINNHLKSAKNYFSMALITYHLANEIESEGYKVTKENYLSFVKEENKNKEKIRIIGNESDVYSRLEVNNENYINKLSNYISLIKSDKNLVKELEVKLKDKLNYYIKSEDYEEEYISAFMDLSSIYKQNNEYEKSLELFISNELILSAINVKYGYVYDTCALILFNADKTKKALKFIDLAIKYYNSNNSSYTLISELMILKTISLLKIEEFDKAKEVFYFNKKKLEAKDLVNTIAYSRVLVLQQTYEQDSSLTLTISNYKRIIKQYELNDEKSDEYFSAVFQLAKLLSIEGKYEKVKEYYLKAHTYFLKGLENELKYKASSSIEFQINNESLELLASLQYFNFRLKGVDDKINKIAIQAALLSKNLKLNIVNNIFKKLLASNDPSLKENVSEMSRSLLEYEASIDYFMEIDESGEVVEKANELAKRQFEFLLSFYFNKFDEPLVKIPDYRNIKLKEDEVFIDYQRVLNFKNQYEYLAYLYTKNKINPSIINLGLEADLKQNTSSDKLQNLTYKNRGTITKSNKKDTYGKQVYDFVWKPISNLIKDYKVVYFSFDGLLNKVPLAAVQDIDGVLLGEKYDLNQISNSSVLINEKSKKPNLNNLLSFGGINYNTSKNEKGSVGFNFLKGTLEEVNNIKKILPTSEIIKGNDATEDKFWSLSGNAPSVIHIATHGFYNEYDKNATGFGSKFKIHIDPLKRTGLILSNGNYGMNNIVKEADGVLTAKEISYLDLSNTEVVVLSACETALGDIDGSEGVYGLQRAFKMAGVSKIIMSLWEVPDAETSEYMIYFYTYWKELKDATKAFKKAQKQMMIKYKNEPEKWAAFILVE